MKKITYSEHVELIKDSKLSIIDLYADWCGPCKMLGPVLESLSKKYTDVNFLKMDVDIEENKQLLRDTQSQGIPTLLFYKSGKIVNKTTGYLPEQALSQVIEDLK